jgi:S-adenosylmethionine decarboxylase
LGFDDVFFEGSEKKAEIVVNGQLLSLLDDFSAQFWCDMVNNCHARILSQIDNAHCKAFLLSESSLFVWKDRLLILTCGETRLVHAVEFFLNNVDADMVLQLTYQRKNECYSTAQPSSFFDDIKRLDNVQKGRAYRFGQLHTHHNYLYHRGEGFQSDSTDQTFELLAYQISSDASQRLTAKGLTRQSIREYLQLAELVPNFIIDDFVFEPFGYSLNAIKGDRYLTIHVTPQATSSYVSFEANFNLIEHATLIMSVLNPASFDLVCFNAASFKAQTSKHIPGRYVCKTQVRDTLSNGYDVCFASYVLPQTAFEKPVLLNTAGETYVF